MRTMLELPALTEPPTTPMETLLPARNFSRKQCRRSRSPKWLIERCSSEFVRCSGRLSRAKTSGTKSSCARDGVSDASGESMSSERAPVGEKFEVGGIGGTHRMQHFILDDHGVCNVNAMTNVAGAKRPAIDGAGGEWRGGPRRATSVLPWSPPRLTPFLITLTIPKQTRPTDLLAIFFCIGAMPGTLTHRHTFACIEVTGTASGTEGCLLLILARARGFRHA